MIGFLLGVLLGLLIGSFVVVLCSYSLFKRIGFWFDVWDALTFSWLTLWRDDDRPVEN